MAGGRLSTRRGGAWTKVVIFVSLYALLLLSLIEWVLVLYLYGNKSVDSKMAPSLVLTLIASFFTVPLITLHSFLAWQYNRVVGFGRQKTILHTACTYILRLTIAIWLASSVAGLVVVSQHVSCLLDGSNASFWKVGVSCALHRTVVIVSVLSFFTVCMYFCSRELCDRPYDVSLLGVYKKQRTSRDDSIFSTSSLGSEKSLKKDILCICRHPDVTYGTRVPYIPSRQSPSEKSTCTPSLQQPTPIRLKPTLQLHADIDAELAEALSGTTASPSDTLFGRHPSDVSCTPTLMAARALQSHPQQLPELPGGPEATYQSNHKRHKSSVSSLRKFLPKAFPVSLSLSDDPQIRALADPNTHVDIEKQAVLQIPDPQPCIQPSLALTYPLDQQQQPQEVSPNAPPEPKNSYFTNLSPDKSLPRSVTMNSAEAPEVVTPAPLNIQKSNITATTTSQTTPPPRTAHYPPHQPSAPRNHQNPSSSSWATLLDTTSRPTRIQTMRTLRRQNHFEPHHIPRYTQSQRFPQNTRRHHSSRALGRSRNDAEPHHQSSRRPLSYRSFSMNSFPGHLDCIRESGQSIDEPSRDNMYGGANRTSTQGY